ncbi:MAG: S8 family serine peptidase [Melioribacteraceae bacterium]|nr:S8 family serine peptidase [Melioribacteraceae bacterium]MDD3558179.1 S8 family serine peptidase [Melioribacteraceae bacterium]
MKFNFIFLIFLSASISAQSTIFFKYKRDVSPVEIEKNNYSILDQSKLFNKKTETIVLKSFTNQLLNKNIDLNSIYYFDDLESEHAKTIKNILEKNPNFEYVQFGNEYNLDYIPNDSLSLLQWNLSTINAFGAWDITEGSDEIIIAVIDTGVDYLHPDLSGSIWINSAEDLNQNGSFDHDDTNGIDDDNNGFIDDVIGWDFTNRAGFPYDTLGGDYLNWDNDPMDQHFHGTFVSGIIGASVNNEIGIAGVVPKVKIMILRAFDPNGTGDEDDVASAVLYAVNMGAKIINMSFGDDKFSYVLKDVLQYAYDNGVVLVGSSGNSGSDQPHYPSGYDFVISVGNSNQNDAVSSSSNFGSTIDLTAPGTGIISTDLNGGYRTAGGTSASAPHVSGASALLLSIDSTLSNEQIKQILKSTSDDIDVSGWDIKSGAGRLNIEKAVQIPLKSEVKINYPEQDFTTSDEIINVNVTVLSPYFSNYELSYGVGITPNNWIKIYESQYQHKEIDVAQIDLSNLPDTSYTLKLLINQNNGITLEERVNFYKDTTPPNIYLGTVAPIIYGDVKTILTEAYTDDRCIVKLYYTSSSSSGYVTLDGFNINNHFVKNYHYGFIPKEIVDQNSEYSLSIEAENLAGMRTRKNIDFIIGTNYEESNLPFAKKEFSLPRGNLFSYPMEFSTQSKGILFQEFYSSDSIFYQLRSFENNTLVIKDSIFTRIPVGFDNFGKENNYLISKFLRNGYVDRQIGSTYRFETEYENRSGIFYPVLVQDIDDNGISDIISNRDNKVYYIWETNNSGQLITENSLKDSLINFSSDNSMNDFHDEFYLNVIAADGNGDGRKEIWTADSDGDLMIFDYSNQSVNIIDSLHSNLTTFHGNTIAAGDINGDGIDEVAILFKGNSIAPFFVLRIFNYLRNRINIIHEQIYLDQSSEFTDPFFTKVFQTLGFEDLDNDNDSELILNIFPYFYIYDFLNNDMVNVFYEEGVNLESIYTGDVDDNGVNEVAIQNSNGHYFIEFGKDNQTQEPKILSAYCVGSFDNVIINVKGEGQVTYLYKGMNENDLVKIDSSSGSTIVFRDRDILTNNVKVYYSVQSYDENKEIPLSNISKATEVFIHSPAKAISAESETVNSVKLIFAGEMPITIFNYTAFNVEGYGIPNSITAQDEQTYLISYKVKFSPGAHDLIIADELRDKYGSPIEGTVLTFDVDEEISEQEFFITKFDILTNNKIKLEFNMEIDRASFSNPTNYVFIPSNEIRELEFTREPNSIIITTKNPVASIGKNYILKLNQVYSINNILITDNAGSSIVIQNFNENIDNVYVYPNPVKQSNFSNGLTFANLTQFAEIYIYTLSGEFVTRLIENDGNGGVTWDLKDDKGNTIPSGIYIYKVIATDSSGNELSYKVEKFAVIK